MLRPYGSKFIEIVESSAPKILGEQLAVLAVKANLPSTYLASILGVSSTTVYQWFRGQGVRENRRHIVEKLISRLTEDVTSGRLPVVGLQESETYIKSIAADSSSVANENSPPVLLLPRHR